MQPDGCTFTTAITTKKTTTATTTEQGTNKQAAKHAAATKPIITADNIQVFTSAHRILLFSIHFGQQLFVTILATAFMNFKCIKDVIDFHYATLHRVLHNYTRKGGRVTADAAYLGLDHSIYSFVTKVARREQ